MQSDLIDIVFRSQKRRDLLLLVGERPRTMEEIKVLLDVSPIAILPHLKKLTDCSLVTQKKGNYELTDMGDQVFKKVQSLVSVLLLLERDNYWTEHDLSGIPQYLLDRIGDLKDCNLVERDPSQIFEPNKEFLNLFFSSKHIMAFSSIYRPEFLFLYSESGRLKSGATLIFTESVLEKILQNHQKKIKKNSSMQNTELFVCNDGVKLAELILSDCGMMISLFDSNGRFYHDYIYCAESQAISWATELFEFYKSRSWQVGCKAVNKNLVYTSESGDVSNIPLLILP